MQPPRGPFVEPPWAAPLDASGVIAEIAPSATIAGMFFLALLEGAKRRGVVLGAPRARYLQFGFYPILEFAPLLVEAARRFHPERPLRQALRSIGAVGPQAFASSVLGRVTLGSAEGVHAAVTAIAKTYEINVRPSSCVVAGSAPRWMLLKLSNVQHFLDSHHVGVFEGTLKYAGVAGGVRMLSHSRVSADFLLEWR